MQTYSCFYLLNRLKNLMFKYVNIKSMQRPIAAVAETKLGILRILSKIYNKNLRPALIGLSNYFLSPLTYLRPLVKSIEKG